MSILIGDVHWDKSSDSPYNRGLRKLFGWLVEEFKHEIWIQSGDYFDSARPNWDVYNEAVGFLLNPDRVILLDGNHDKSKNIGSCLQSLNLHSNIEVYNNKTEIKIGKQTWLILPDLYSSEAMKEYENIEEEFDFGIGHIAPIGTNFGKDEIDLKCKFRKAMFYGHIHIPMRTKSKNHIIIGVPQPTRNGEQHHQPVIYNIDDDTGEYKKIDVPKFMTIENIKYDEEPFSKDNIINVVNAPSIQSVRDRYQGYNIREEGIELALDSTETIENKINNFSEDLEGKFTSWSIIEEIEKEYQDCIFEYFRAIPE